MTTPKAKLSYGEVYKKSLDLCLFQWPILPLQLLYGILNWGALLGCVLLLFWPFLQKLLGDFSMDQLEQLDPEVLGGQIMGLFQTPGWFLSALGIILLYGLWWTLLLLLVSGGIFGRFWAGAKDKVPFSIKAFGGDCLKYFSGMFLLLAFYLFLVILLLVAAVIVEFGAIFFFAVLHLPGWIGILMIFPAGLLALAVFALFAVYISMSHAALMEDKGVGSAISQGWSRCIADRGRVLWATFLMSLLWFAAALFIEVMFFFLKRIPVLGDLFEILDLLFGLFLYVAGWSYFSALAVTLYQEKED